MAIKIHFETSEPLCYAVKTYGCSMIAFMHLYTCDIDRWLWKPNHR